MFNKADDSLVTYHLPVNTYSFAKIHKVGAGVEANAVALRLKDGCQRVAGASFSIGPAYMDSTIVLMRMVKVLIQQVSVA